MGLSVPKKEKKKDLPGAGKIFSGRTVQLFGGQLLSTYHGLYGKKEIEGLRGGGGGGGVAAGGESFQRKISNIISLFLGPLGLLFQGIRGDFLLF